MAQHDYIISNATFPAVRTDLNNALSAIQTTNSGTSRPTGAVAGQLWLDTTSATTPTLKYYDGADDISLATIDHTANTVNWLDSTVSITGLSTTATGTVLTLSDSASTSTVNLIIDNQKEIRFRETTANGTNYVGLKAPASLSADLTYTLPSADGTSGQALITNGSGVLSFTTISGDGTVDWDTTVKTSGFTATANKGYFCNTTSSAFTVTLPSSPSAGDEIVIVDYAGTFATNNLNIASTPNINGSTNDVLLTTNREATRLVYIDSTQGWLSYSGVNEGTAPSLTDNPPTYSVDFLVIAGGASGSSGTNSSAARAGGGGGAGGYRSSNATYGGSGGGASAESSLTFTIGTVYTVTVGAGGASTTTEATTGNNGSNSSISGTGISTITSTGGGTGGKGQSPTGQAGATGGSGGGAGSGNPTGGTGGSGTANQGRAGGNGFGGGNGGGGGGGANAVGSNASSPDNGGNGGTGVASTVTGSSITRAGGGGGAGNVNGTGGTGGGGNGAKANSPTSVATSGSTNTGSGGGGAFENVSIPSGATTGAGGSGVVILRMPTAKYSSTTTGSPTVTTSGSDTILTYTGSGSYTA
jgi:hypothetical protein